MEYPGAVAPEREWTLRSLGLDLHVCEWGAGDAMPVVLLHGFYDHARSFDLLAPLLAERYRVVALDARGHGNSDWPDAYTWPADVTDVVTLLRALGEPVHLLGHSRGGGLANDAAILSPDQVERLVILDGFGPPSEGFRAEGMERLDGTVPELLATYLDWRREAAHRTSFRPCDTLDELAERRRRQNPRLSLEWLRYFAHHGARHTPEGYVWKVDPLASRNFGPFDPEWIAPGWRRLRMPMLGIIGGEEDTWGPLPAEILDARLAHVPKLERATIEGAGHFMHIERPGETAERILSFLSEPA
jgi:pimeloyl-ACP methyl ester carboxylesterase